MSSNAISPRYKNQITLGVFDSGIGGLSVLKRLWEAAPFRCHECQIDYVYLADTQRFPYGQRSSRQIQDFTAESLSWLAQKNCAAIVTACHTAATAARLSIFDLLPVPVYDLSDLGQWLSLPVDGNFVVLATPATALSGVISKSLTLRKPAICNTEIACPELAPLIENTNGSPETQERKIKCVLQKYAEQIVALGADTVILGCTHYPLIASQLKELLPPHVVVIDPAIDFSEHLFADSQFKAIAKRGKTSAKFVRQDRHGQIEFYVTGSIEEFERKKHLYAPELSGAVHSVNIEELTTAREFIMPSYLVSAAGF